MRRLFRAVLTTVAVTVLAAPAAHAFDPAKSKITVQGSGQVEIYINGQYMGRSADATRLAAYTRALVIGDNAIALRATKGVSKKPFAVADLNGAFGRMGSGVLWRARLASGSEISGLPGAWAALGYDDSNWPVAVELDSALPKGFPKGGPANKVWVADGASGTMLLRANLYVPATPSSTPLGFGAAVTGGAGGSTVVVTTPDALRNALCGSFSGSTCTDATPRVVKVKGLIDFTGTEGPQTKLGCDYSECGAPWKRERLVLLNDADTHCDGKTQYNITFDKSGASALAIGSNKTLVGIGNGATIRGKGVSVTQGASNVIIRNLTFRDLNPGVIFAGDAISLNNADRVWIDHNRFHRIGRQMIVTGFGKASNVTISWNDFDGSNEYGHYCDGRHYWNMLLLGDGDRITLNNNWFRHFSGRAPDVGSGSGSSMLHMANNAFTDGGWHALDARQPARVLVEGNHYENVAVPVLDGSNPGYIWAPLTTVSDSAQQNCRSFLGRDCTANISVPLPQDNNFRHDLTVLDYFNKFAPPGGGLAPFGGDQAKRSAPHFAGPGHY
jgi:pectate lyase